MRVKKIPKQVIKKLYLRPINRVKGICHVKYYTTANPLPEESQRGQRYNPMLIHIEKLVEVMQQVGDHYEASVAQVAMAWAMAKGTIPIVGVTTTEQVREIAQAVQMTLTAEEISRLEAVALEVSVNTRGGWEQSMLS